jgi:hypothetical protein
MDQPADVEKGGLNGRVRFECNRHDVSCPPAGNVSGDRSLRRPLLYVLGPLPLHTVTFFDRAHPRNGDRVHPARSGTNAGHLAFS